MGQISHIDFFEKGYYDITLNIKKNTESFEVHIGRYSSEAEELGNLLETGISFSGENGYIFDQDGVFFGGYKPNVDCKLSIVKKDYDNFSYYFNGSLIANQKASPTKYLNAIKFTQYQTSSLKGVSASELSDNVEAGTFGDFLEDNLDNWLYSSDNILLISHL